MKHIIVRALSASVQAILFIKTILISLLLATITIGMATASAKKEALPWETIKVTGKLSFKDWPNPEITSYGKTYELLIPRHRTYDLEVKEGEALSVEGYLVERGLRGDDEQYIMVTKAVIDGEEYDFDKAAQIGPRWGMMGRHGRPLAPKGRGRW